MISRDFKSISNDNNSTGISRSSTPIIISRGSSIDGLNDADLEPRNYTPWTPLDTKKMIDDANAKELLENVISALEDDKKDKKDFVEYLEYYKRHIKTNKTHLDYLLTVYKDISIQYDEFLKNPLVDKEQAKNDLIITSLQELIIFVETLKTKNTLETAGNYLRIRGEGNVRSPFKQYDDDYPRIEQTLRKIGKDKEFYQAGKTKGNKLFSKNKTIKKKKTFFFNSSDPKTSFDVYIDKNPNDTIPIKYTTVQDVKDTIIKLEKLYKKGKYSHKRIWQVGMIMKVRLEAMLKHKDVLYPNAKNVKRRFNLANKYFLFLSKRTTLKEEDRKKLVFKF